MFMIIKQSHICNFVDDNTLCACGERLAEIKENLICDKKNIFQIPPKNLVKSSIVVALQPGYCKPVTLVKGQLIEISRSAILWS